MSKVQTVLAIHAEMLENNPYCYFELAFSRTTDWMIWICSNAREKDPNRKVLLCGQGSTPEDAAEDALEKFKEQPND